MSTPFSGVEDASKRFEAVGYLPSRETATSAFLMDRLEKPVLIEGPAGVGKTEFAKALAQSLGRELIRLQCYEGLDEAKALYEWSGECRASDARSLFNTVWQCPCRE